MKQKLLQSTKIIVLALVVAFGIQFAMADWVSAPPNPPQNNANAPINVGESPQIKLGPLQVNTDVTNPISPIGLSVFGTTYLAGKLGVGTNAPSAPLTVQAPSAAPNASQVKIIPDANNGSTISSVNASVLANGMGSVYLGANAKFDGTSWTRINDSSTSWVQNLGYGDQFSVFRAAPGTGTVNYGTARFAVKADGTVTIPGGSPQNGYVLKATDNLGNSSWAANTGSSPASSVSQYEFYSYQGSPGYNMGYHRFCALSRLTDPATDSQTRECTVAFGAQDAQSRYQWYGNAYDGTTCRVICFDF